MHRNMPQEALEDKVHYRGFYLTPYSAALKGRNEPKLPQIGIKVLLMHTKTKAMLQGTWSLHKAHGTYHEAL
jgi:hypothetical protein